MRAGDKTTTRSQMKKLKKAAEDDDVKAIQKLKEEGANLNARDQNGKTPVHHAANKGNLRAIRVLAELGAEVTVKDNEGETPVHHAAIKGHAGAIRVLLDAGADVTATDNHGFSPFHTITSPFHTVTTRNGRDECINALARAGCSAAKEYQYAPVTHNSSSPGGVLHTISSGFQKRIDDQNTSDEDKEALEKEKAAFEGYGGHCLGFGILNSVMHLQGKGIWWRCALALLCNQKDLPENTPVQLPDSDGPIPFGDLFEKVVTYLFQCQRLYRFKQIANPDKALIDGVTKQDHIFEYIEILQSENIALNDSSTEGEPASFDGQISEALQKLTKSSTRHRKILIKNAAGHLLAEVTSVSNPLICGDEGAEETKGGAPAIVDGQCHIFTPHDGSRMNSPGRSELVSASEVCDNIKNKFSETKPGEPSETNELSLEVSEEKCLYCPKDEIKKDESKVDLTAEKLMESLNALGGGIISSKTPCIIELSIWGVLVAHSVSIRPIYNEDSDADPSYAFYDSNCPEEKKCVTLEGLADHIVTQYSDTYQTFQFTLAPLIEKPKEWSIESINAVIGESHNNPNHPHILNRVDQNGDTLLLWAAQNRSEAVISALKMAGADVNTRDRYDRTPVYIAAENGHVEAIQVLAELGADLDTADRFGNAPVYIAAHNGHAEAIQVLADAGADFEAAHYNDMTAIFVAAWLGHVEAIRVLADLGANLDAADKFGNTPIYAAAKNGHMEAFRVLVELGANLTVTKNQGRRSLFDMLDHQACGMEQVVNALALAGCPQSRDHLSWTELHKAACDGKAVDILRLPDLAAHVRARDSHGRTPFDIITEQGSSHKEQVINALACAGCPQARTYQIEQQSTVTSDDKKLIIHCYRARLSETTTIRDLVSLYNDMMGLECLKIHRYINFFGSTPTYTKSQITLIEMFQEEAIQMVIKSDPPVQLKSLQLLSELFSEDHMKNGVTTGHSDRYKTIIQKEEPASTHTPPSPASASAEEKKVEATADDSGSAASAASAHTPPSPASASASSAASASTASATAANPVSGVVTNTVFVNRAQQAEAEAKTGATSGAGP